MARNNTRHSLLTGGFLVAISLLFGACGSQPLGNASLDPNSISIQAITGPIVNCAAATHAGAEGGHGKSVLYAGAEGGHGKSAIYASTTCTTITLDITGTAISADSVLLNIDAQTFSVEVDESTGRFSARLTLSSAPENITLMPMNGDLTGPAVLFDSSKITSLY